MASQISKKRKVSNYNVKSYLFNKLGIGSIIVNKSLFTSLFDSIIIIWGSSENNSETWDWIEGTHCNITLS